MQSFLESFGDRKDGILCKMTPAEFHDNIEAVVSRYEASDEQLRGEASRISRLVKASRLTFTDLVDVVGAVKALKKEDVVDFFDQYMRAGGPGRRKFLSIVKAGQPPAKAEGDAAPPPLSTGARKAPVRVASAASLKNGCPLYPDFNALGLAQFRGLPTPAKEASPVAGNTSGASASSRVLLGAAVGVAVGVVLGVFLSRRT